MIAGGERYRRALVRMRALQPFGVRPGLETTARLCAGLGHPEARFTAIQIAGSNGKGSTAAIADSLLREDGVATGLYTSPHLLRFTERFRIGGAEVVADRCADALDRVLDAADAAGLEPTFFEAATVAAFVLFAEAGVTLAVLECGLGGRLDATTVCRPAVSVITRIALEHVEVLGPTLERIAHEKAGILRAGVPVVVGPLPDEARAVITGRAGALGCPLFGIGAGIEVRHGAGAGGAARLDYRGPGGPLLDAPLGLAGPHQADNAALALAAVACLPRTLDEETRRRGLAGARWPGRLEEVAPGVRVDGAHNADGARALALALAGERHTLVLGLLSDKDAEAVLAALLPSAVRLVVTRAPSPRAIAPALLARIAGHLDPSMAIEVVEAPADALARARATPDPVLVAGSLYLVGAVRGLMTGEAADPLVVADPMGVQKLEG